MLCSLCRVLAATNCTLSGYFLIFCVFGLACFHDCMVLIVHCSISYTQDKCLLIVYVVLSISSCSLICLGSETVILASTFQFLISHTTLWYMTCHCSQGMLKLLTPFFIKVYSHCIANLSRKKAQPFLWVSITKDVSDIVGILPFGGSSTPCFSFPVWQWCFSLPKWFNR